MYQGFGAAAKDENLRTLARNLHQGQVIIVRNMKGSIVDHIEVLSKAITDQNGPKRVLVWSADDLHYTYGIDESVEVAE